MTSHETLRGGIVMLCLWRFQSLVPECDDPLRFLNPGGFFVPENRREYAESINLPHPLNAHNLYK